MKVILGAVVWLLILLLLGVPLLILYLVKLCVALIHCRGAPCGGRGGGGGGREDNNDVKLFPLPPGDAMFGLDASWVKPTMNFGVVLRVEGEVEVGRLRDHFDKCFINISGDGENPTGDRLPYDRFFSYLVKRGGYVFRACSRSSLKLTEQIVERKLEVGESLEEFLSRWILEGYREHRPCWEMAVIPEIIGPNNGTAVAFKIHHSLCDGYSVLHILDKLTGTKSPYLVKDFRGGFLTEAQQMLEMPVNLGKMGGGSPEKNTLQVHLPPPPERRKEWMLSFTSFPLDDLKAVRRKHGNVHMAAVLLAVVSGGIRRFLLEEQVELPEDFWVGVTFPWPKHPAMDPATRNPDKMCNHWVSGIFPIPLKEPDALVRLSKIELEFTSYLALGLDKFAKRVLLPLISLLPAPAIENSLSSKDFGIGLGLTSLVGGDSYSLLGLPVPRIHPIIAVHDNAPYNPASIFSFSHGGRLELTLGAHPRTLIKNFRNLNRICHQLCQDELQVLMTRDPVRAKAL